MKDARRFFAPGVPLVWNTTDAERSAHYPCDDVPFVATYEVFRAVDVAAPAALTYRWLCQLQAAPYSYDWLDNGGRPSPPKLSPGLGIVKLGGPAMLVFRVVGYEWGTSLTLRMRVPLVRALFGDIVGSYVIAPRGDTASRIVAKARIALPANRYGRLVRAPMEWIDYAMFRHQLLKLRRYILESDQQARLASGRSESIVPGEVGGFY